ncbi:DUF2065 domain-containing protein [Methylophilaceae bacterium]|nr:DUF2065 domain-containing protein [Nitrosomonadales bacterium]MCH9781816.1 DUF2065 domain-containing protein [Betaproteobacteria bacterium]MDC0115006.1 DUF2065 domain-containing protein [Methylophilaceae bacterium]MBT5410894.1 DUF2065 domain-containing protein [Nitrosomonadales bacterium]MBT6141342.1 DUF2065 domain-containing protein [Nitrosomonadales bacterium]
MPETLAIAFGLFFLLEGILPLIFPSIWRETFKKVTEFNDGQIRFFGFFSVLLGIMLILIAN